MQTIFLCEATFNFPRIWKRTRWNRNRYNWNELNNTHIAVIHYGKWNWQLWRMYQINCILQFAAVPIYVMLVIIRQYQFSCVDDYNHVHYTAHIFWSRCAYSGKHHAVPVSSYVTIFQFQNHHPTGQQKTIFWKSSKHFKLSKIAHARFVLVLRMGVAGPKTCLYYNISTTEGAIKQSMLTRRPINQHLYGHAVYCYTSRLTEYTPRSE